MLKTKLQLKPDICGNSPWLPPLRYSSQGQVLQSKEAGPSHSPPKAVICRLEILKSTMQIHHSLILQVARALTTICPDANQSGSLQLLQRFSPDLNHLVVAKGPLGLTFHFRDECLPSGSLRLRAGFSLLSLHLAHIFLNTVHLLLHFIFGILTYQLQAALISEKFSAMRTVSSDLAPQPGEVAIHPGAHVGVRSWGFESL